MNNLTTHDNHLFQHHDFDIQSRIYKRRNIWAGSWSTNIGHSGNLSCKNISALQGFLLDKFSQTPDEDPVGFLDLPAKISGIKILASPLLNLRFCLDGRLLTLSTAPAVDKLLWTRIKTVMALPLSTRNLFNILAILSAFARVCAFHFRLAAGTPGWTASFPATTF